MGRPTEYDPAYCQILMDHMEKGGTFESFAAKIRHSKQTLYNWLKVYPDFVDAKNIGEGLSLQFYLNLGNMIATGQLRRLKSEKPLIIDGKVQYDANGNVLMEREWEYTSGGQSTWIFMMKNIHKWHDRIDMKHGGMPVDEAPPITIDVSGWTKEQLERRMTELMLKMQKGKK